MKINALLLLLTTLGAAACGGNSQRSEAPKSETVAGAPTTPQVVAPTANPAPSTAPQKETAPAVTPSVPYNFYRLGGGNTVGSATLDGATLNINGVRYTDVNLMPGNCSINSGNLTQCRSTDTIDALTLCGTDQGSNKFTSMYVLFDPDAIQITDSSILRNITFSGYEDCGSRNIGAQPKSAPSSKLSFDKDGNLTLTRFDSDPPKTNSVPSYFVNTKSDTTAGGVTARLNLYRVNDRYMIIATGAPTSGATSANPGTLVAFYQD